MVLLAGFPYRKVTVFPLVINMSSVGNTLGLCKEFIPHQIIH